MKAHCSSSSEALELVQSGHRVFIHGGTATPFRLIEGLMTHQHRLKDVELIHLHTLGNAPYSHPDFASNFRVANLFVGENLRHRLISEQVDYLPCFLSEIPNLFRSKKRALDVALVHVSAPDAQGYCSLGTSVDVALAAVESAPIIIAQINRQMPRVHGDGFVHLSRFDRTIEVDDPIPEVKPHPIENEEAQIGKFVAGLIEEGSTLQMGIGSIPDAVLASLKDHRHLGIHTEMWTDGALALIQSGAVDNSRKKVHPGKTVSGFVMGTKALYDFINDNPSVIQLDISYVNAPNTIARNPKVAAINSAVEIDLTGQVCADSIGCKIISGVGGQMDFMRGAALSEGGKPIIALTSRTRHGIPRIVHTLSPGAGVVTTRAHVHYVVTEYGVADLYGKTLSERARELIRIAHPEDRDSLTQAWKTNLK